MRKGTSLRERLLFTARGGDIIIPFDQLFLDLDWGRVSDKTIATIGKCQNDVLDWFACPKTRYEEQIELLLAELKLPRSARIKTASTRRSTTSAASPVSAVNSQDLGLSRWNSCRRTPDCPLVRTAS